MGRRIVTETLQSKTGAVKSDQYTDRLMKYMHIPDKIKMLSSQFHMENLEMEGRRN